MKVTFRALKRAFIAGLASVCAGTGLAAEWFWRGESGGRTSVGSNWTSTATPITDMWFTENAYDKTIVFDAAHTVEGAVRLGYKNNGTAEDNRYSDPRRTFVWQADPTVSGAGIDATGMLGVAAWSGSPESLLRIEGGTYAFGTLNNGNYWNTIGVMAGSDNYGVLELAGGTLLSRSHLWCHDYHGGHSGAVIIGSGDAAKTARLTVAPAAVTMLGQNLQGANGGALTLKAGGILETSFIIWTSDHSTLTFDGGTLVKNGDLSGTTGLGGYNADKVDLLCGSQYNGFYGSDRTIRFTDNGGTIDCAHPVLVDAALALADGATSSVLTKQGAEPLTLTGTVADTIGVNVQEGVLKVRAGTQFASIVLAEGARFEIDCARETNTSPLKAGGTLTVPAGVDPASVISLTGTYASRYMLVFDQTEPGDVYTGIRLIEPPQTAVWNGPAAGAEVTDADCAVSKVDNWDPNGMPSKVWRFEGGSAGKVAVFDRAVTLAASNKLDCHVQVGDTSADAFKVNDAPNPVVWRASDANYGFADLSGGVYVADGKNQSNAEYVSGALRIESGYYKAGGSGQNEPRGLCVGNYGLGYFELAGGTFRSEGDVCLARKAGAVAVIGSNEPGAERAVLDVDGKHWLYVSADGGVGSLTVRKSGTVRTSYLKSSNQNSSIVLDGGTLVKSGNTDDNHYYGSREVPIQVTANGATLKMDDKGVITADIVDADPESAKKGTLVKTGAADLVFPDQKSYTGATVVEQGRLVLAAGVQVGSSLTLAKGTQVVIDFANATADGAINYTLVAAGGTVELPAGDELSDMVTIQNDDAFDLTVSADGGNITISGTVKEGMAVAQIGKVNYISLGGALAAAKAGETVTLLKDVAFSGSLEIAAENVTFNLNGHVLTRASTGANLQFMGGGVLTNGTLVPDAGLGVNPIGSERDPLVGVGEGKTLTVRNVTAGDTSGHEPFCLFFLRKRSHIAVEGGDWHAATVMSSSATGDDVSHLDISGGRFYMRGWHFHDPNGKEDYHKTVPVITGGSFALPPRAGWLAAGSVVLHDVTDTETPYHVVAESSDLYSEEGWSYCYVDEAAAAQARVAKRTVDGEEKFYTSLADAVKAAQPDETVSVIADVTALDASVTIDKALTVEGNGHLVKVRNPFVAETGYVATDFTLEFSQVFLVAQWCDATLRNIQLMGGGIIEAENNNNGSYAVQNVGNLMLDNVTITRSNGAVMNQKDGRLFVDNCRLVRNCRYCAGGIFNYGVAVLNRSSLSENRSLSTTGGGGAAENPGLLYINNCVICNNSSTEIGGALNHYGPGADIGLYIMNSTIAGNFSAAGDFRKSPTEQATPGSYEDYGGGIGLRAFKNHATFLGVNNLIVDNYQVKLRGNGTMEIVPSDMSGLAEELLAGGMKNELYYSVYRSFRWEDSTAQDGGVNVSGAGAPAHDIVLAEEDAENVFNAYYPTERIYQNNLKTTMAVNGAQLVSKDDGSLNADLARYAPVKRTVSADGVTYGSAVLGTAGVYTYFDASDWKNGNIKMSYAPVQEGAEFDDLDKAGVMVALGTLPMADADHMVTNYYESATGRSFGVAGASGWLEEEKHFYTIRLAGEVEHGTVSGITLYGDTYEEGTEVTLTATPGFARTFLGWYKVDPVTGEKTLIEGSDTTLWTFTVTEDLVLEPRFSEMSELFNPIPKVHVTMADGQEHADKPLYPVKVTTVWMLAQYPDIDTRIAGKTQDEQEAILTELLEVKDEDTGLQKWQDYVLGITPGSKDAALWIDSPQYKAVNGDSIRLKMNDLTPVTGSGFQVRYRLDKKLGAATAFTRDAVNATGVFDVDVATDPTGRYVIDLLFVPDGEATSEEYVTSVNTAGILRVETAAERAALAVPWAKLAPSGNASVAAVNLVKTMNLTTGDKLYVYDGAKKQYKAWQLRESGLWESLAVYSLDQHGNVDWTAAGEAGDSSVPRGAGIWLERQNTEGYVYLVGQVDETPVTTPVTAGWNLVGNPTTSAYDLANINPGWQPYRYYRLKIEETRNPALDAMHISYFILRDAEGNDLMDYLMANKFRQGQTDCFFWATEPAPHETHPPVRALDSSIDSNWVDSRLDSDAAWVGVDFGEPRAVASYEWGTAWDWDAADPSAWRFQGSNDKTNWVDLEVKTDYVATEERSVLGYKSVTNGSMNDRIVVPTAAEPKNMTFENGSWGYWKNMVFTLGDFEYVKPVWTTTDKLVPAGTAFWYISSGDGALTWTSESNEEVR